MWNAVEKLLLLTIGVLVVAVSAGRLGAADPPESWTAEVMMTVKRIGSVQVSPDGKEAVYTVREAVMESDRSEYRTHLYLYNPGGGCGGGCRLTQGDASCDDPQWSPDGRCIAFVSARSGKKNLWIISPAGGEAQQLSDVKTGVGNYKWSPKGDALAFTALDAPTAEDEKAARQKNDARVVDEKPKMSRLYIIPYVESDPIRRQEARLLTNGDFSLTTENNKAGRAPFDWSPDGKTIVFAHAKSAAPNDWPSSDLSLVDVADSKIRPLVHSGAAAASPLYSPDSKSIAYVAGDDPPKWADGGRVHVIPAAGGQPRALAETSDGWGRYSELVGWSADGKKLYFSEAHHMSLKLLTLPLDGGAPETVYDRPGMSPGGVFLNARRTHFGFSWEDWDMMPEAWIAQVDHFSTAQLSNVNAQWTAGRLPAHGQTAVNKWKSKDCHEIEGLLTYPIGWERGKRFPLVLIIHGGPMGAFMRSYDGTPTYHPVAAFAARGYAVLRPNPRGSVGYGLKFRRANYGDWGGGDFADLMAGVDHVIDQGIADPDRMGVMGWSYGGYMTSWIITHTHRFAAASAGGAVTDLAAFTGTADIPDFLPDYFGGEFWDKPEVYQEHSPISHVKGVTTPTLIQHGELDERVPLSQGEELYNALKRQGCTTKMVIYPRTHHGIEEPRLLLDSMNRNLEWFDRYVRDARGDGNGDKGQAKP